jgi:hypothetical protein
LSPEVAEIQEPKDEAWVTLDQMRSKARKNKSNADKLKPEKEVAVTKDVVKQEENGQNRNPAQNEVR